MIKKTKEFMNVDDKSFEVTTYENRESFNRAFKGVWIPKEIWENKELSWMEKLFLTEINSLDNDNGCFASNNYFASFFDLSKGRCSQIIKSLEEKKYINIKYTYKKNTNEIEKRIIKVFSILNTCLENDKDNNTINNKDLLLSKDNKKVSSKLTNPFENSMLITEECFNLFYNKLHIIKPRVKKEKVFSNEEIEKVDRYIKYFIKGFPKGSFKKLELFIKQKNIDFNSKIGFKDENLFREYFLKAIKIYDKEYGYDDKRNLPNRLSDFLYNSFPSFVSYFLYNGFNPPKKLNVDPVKRKDKYPKITQKYIESFKVFENLDTKSHNKLIINISKIVENHSKIVNAFIIINERKIFRHEFENDYFGLYLEGINSFVNNHIEYLKANEQANPEGFSMNIDKLYIGGYWWEKFQEWFYRRYELKFYISKEDLLYKHKLYKFVEDKYN